VDEPSSGVDEPTPADVNTNPADASGSPAEANDRTSEPAGELLNFTCPRCSTEVREVFYGPCSDCRATMRIIHGADVEGTASEVPSDFEPKMNVTPNAVALKD
jgi:hypothetical protein